MGWGTILRVAPRMARPGRLRLASGRFWASKQTTSDFGTIKRFQSSSTTIEPPRARQAQGPDPYAWLEDQNDEVLEYLTADNRHTCEVMRKTLPLQEMLYKEMIHRADRHLDNTPPERIRGFWYYSRREEGGNFPVYYRSKQAPELQPQGWQAVEETVVLDQNALPEFYQYFHVGDMKVSPDGDLLAFTLAAHDSSAGVGTLYLRDLSKADGGGRWWTAEAWSRVVGFEWGGSHVLYTTHDDHLGRPSTVRRSVLDKNRIGLTGPPQRVWEEADDQFFVSLRRTKDGRFVTIHSNSKASGEVWLLDGTKDDGRPVRVCPRRPQVQYFVDHAHDHFYVITNARHGLEYELCRLPSSSLSTAEGGGDVAWETAEWGGPTALTEGTCIEDLDVFQDFLVLYDRVHGRPGMRVLDLRGGEGLGEAGAWHRVALPSEVQGARLQPGLNQDYEASTVRFALTSPVLPRVTFDYDMGQRALTVLQHEAMDDGQNGRYVCTHVLTPATPEHPISVPLTLAHKEGVALDGSNPVLLLGYGAYGVCVDVGFKVEYLPLLQRGWVLAFAHPRGGGELGRAWHQDGRGERKANSVVDYLRCAEWLVEEGYAKKGRVAGYGGSAGGLLVAAAANRRPELFGAMVLKVPFLDIVRTMCDPTLPLTIHEFDEWGDPGSEAKVLQAMHAYSPYETLPGGGARYPDTLVLASLADDRVRYWEAAKWVAKARQACPSSLFLLRVEASRGHAGHATQSEMMHESAFEGAFLISALGPSDALDEKPSKYPSHQRRRRRPARDSPYARVPVLAWPVVPIQ